MNTNILAMVIAVGAVLGLVITLGGLNLLVGAITPFLTRPKLTFLRTHGKSHFAFAFDWNSSKDPVTLNTLRIRLHNPFGSPTYLELNHEFEGHQGAFVEEVDFGLAYSKFLSAKGFDSAHVTIEVSSTTEGTSFHFEMKGLEFKRRLQEANLYPDEAKKKIAQEEAQDTASPVYFTVEKNMVADTVPGKGAVLKLATNPLFAGGFAEVPGTATPGAAAGGGQAAAAQENFKVEKVWIAPGCIVCNACEDIYPEVFEVLSNTCIIRPNAPLNDGLRIQEASDACPVEVIKYTKAAS